MKRFFNNQLKKVRNLKLPKNKVTKFFILLGSVFFLFTFFGGDFGFIRIWNLHQKKNELELQSKKLQVDIMDLQVEKDRLQKDTLYIEKLAREKLGMVKKGEKVYQFVLPVEDSTLKSNTDLPK